MKGKKLTTAAKVDNPIVQLATTTSLVDSGLFSELEGRFYEQTGYFLDITAVGTGRALELGRQGKADVLFTHAKEEELVFVSQGYASSRHPVMYNYFNVVGPINGPIEPTSGDAGLKKVFQQISDEQIGFVSRGDESGTHVRENEIWAALGINPHTNPNYISANLGMGATLVLAAHEKDYTLSDRGTWLATLEETGLYPTVIRENLRTIVEEGDLLLNQYASMVVKVSENGNQEGGKAFVDFLISSEIQKLIGEFGIAEYNEPLFTPNANDPNA